MSNYDSWKTRSDRDEYPEDEKFDASWREDEELLGELYDEDDFYIDTTDFETLIVEKEINSMISLIPVR